MYSDILFEGITLNFDKWAPPGGSAQKFITEVGLRHRLLNMASQSPGQTFISCIGSGSGRTPPYSAALFYKYILHLPFCPSGDGVGTVIADPPSPHQRGSFSCPPSPTGHRERVRLDLLGSVRMPSRRQTDKKAPVSKRWSPTSCPPSRSARRRRARSSP